jgi:hypothetical protein
VAAAEVVKGFWREEAAAAAAAAAELVKGF